jgi:hypothetical protein
LVSYASQFDGFLFGVAPPGLVCFDSFIHRAYALCYVLSPRRGSFLARIMAYVPYSAAAAEIPCWNVPPRQPFLLTKSAGGATAHSSGRQPRDDDPITTGNPGWGDTKHSATFFCRELMFPFNYPYKTAKSQLNTSRKGQMKFVTTTKNRAVRDDGAPFLCTRYKTMLLPHTPESGISCHARPFPLHHKIVADSSVAYSSTLRGGQVIRTLTPAATAPSVHLHTQYGMHGNSGIHFAY